MSSTIYTIGYERRSIDEFIECLIKNNIAQLIDVRSNPQSRKPGFSRLNLAETLERYGIRYLSFPALGIPSERRKRFPGIANRRTLLDWYEDNIVTLWPQEIKVLLEFIRQKPSVLMCFERDPTLCHRLKLANLVSNLTGQAIVHLL
jgi:uncharacterized protein (DUF488 family)